MTAIFAIVQLLSLPIIILNTIGVVVTIVWLGYLGEWWALGYGLVLMLVGTHALGLVLIPGMVLAGISARYLDKGNMAVSIIATAMHCAYTLFIMGIWVYFIFHLFLNHGSVGEAYTPLLIMCFLASTGPWDYMLSKEPNDSMSSTISTMAVNLACLIIILLGWWQGYLYKYFLINILAIFLGLAFLFMSIMMMLSLKEQARQRT